MSPLDPSMEDLPVEVMVDILSRLAVKTIIWCKCVCKKWLNIVLDSCFANLHLSRSPAGIMFHQKSKKEMNGDKKPGILKWVEVEDELDHHHLHQDPVMSLDLNLIAPNLQKSKLPLVSSVNGLLCLWQYGKGKDKTYICNPITREYMILHGQKYDREDSVDIVYGFGVGSVKKEYKVIRVIAVDIPPNPTSTFRLGLSEAEVYTLGTGQWRSLGHVPYLLNGFYAPFLNGHAHWIVDDQDSPEKICAFDFDLETFKSFPSPRVETIQERPLNFRRLGVLKGCLFPSVIYDYTMTVWVMKEYGIKKSWHKELVIETSMIPNLGRLTMGLMHIIKGLKDETVLMASYTDELFAFCPRRKTIIDRKISGGFFKGLAHRPSFHRLHSFENERVHVF